MVSTTSSSISLRFWRLSGATRITLLVKGFQKALLSAQTASSACVRVTLGNSTLIFREEKSGSKITLRPASLAIVSKTIRASLIILRLTGSREIGASSGGPDRRFWAVPGIWLFGLGG